MHILFALKWNETNDSTKNLLYDNETNSRVENQVMFLHKDIKITDNDSGNTLNDLDMSIDIHHTVNKEKIGEQIVSHENVSYAIVCGCIGSC